MRPKSVTYVTPKKRYRDSTRKWIRILSQVEESDGKYKSLLFEAGSLIFWAWDTKAQDMFRKDEMTGKDCLDRHFDDSEQIKLVREGLSIFVKRDMTRKGSERSGAIRWN